MRVIAVIDHQGSRPSPDWHAHGWTHKYIWVVYSDGLRLVLLRKPRWRHRETGLTCHDRPACDRPGSPYGLDVVFAVVGAWLLATTGLHSVLWPCGEDEPARRTAQRWLRWLLPDAARWLQSIRLACIELAAPRPLEEILPTGGIPPPGARSRRQTDIVAACRLKNSAWTLKNAARFLCIPTRTLLTEARRRWSATKPTIS